MSLGNECKISKTANSYILYDAGIIAEPALQLFNRDYHTNQSPRQKKSEPGFPGGRQGEQQGGIGRAPVVYFSQGENSFVLKHYYRGGAIASILKDRYLGFSVIKSRAFREFRLLKKMHELGLPVPVAVAAHTEKGILSYRADLVTEELKQTETLSDILSDRVLPDDAWQKIGQCIKRFHQHDIYHADLNARNILLSESMKIFLIDFDNSYIRPGSGSDTWKLQNLSRFKRSLLKFKNNTDGFNFDEDDWSALLAGYK
jgi:3-deoxy-D-manno-octulosonic acid kinase